MMIFVFPPLRIITGSGMIMFACTCGSYSGSTQRSSAAALQLDMDFITSEGWTSSSFTVDELHITF